MTEGQQIGTPVSVIIPARNEALSLPNLLHSLLIQSVRPGQIIVVDDHSTDGTAEIAAGYGAQVLDPGNLPPGWTGKPWACWNGAQAAAGHLFLFLDADTVLEPDGLERMLACLSESKGILTLQPYHRIQKAYENLSALFNIILMGGMNAFTPLGDRLQPIGAFGPCLLCRREDYFAIGGHARARGAVLEDLALGGVFVRTQIPVCCLGGRGTLSFRMYPGGVGQVIEGWSKGFTVGARTTPLFSLLLIVAWVTGSISSTNLLLSSLLAPGGVPWAYALALYAAYALQIGWMLRRIGNFSLWAALLYPINVLFFVAVFFRSLFLTLARRQVRWKGRTIDTHPAD